MGLVLAILAAHYRLGECSLPGTALLGIEVLGIEVLGIEVLGIEVLGIEVLGIEVLDNRVELLRVVLPHIHRCLAVLGAVGLRANMVEI